MAAISQKLELKLKNLPTVPGVYLFNNKHKKIIYIGKAKNLKNRVRTYFQKSANHDKKTSRMVTQIDDLELMVTENEIESLILESNLVHEHRPRYNIFLKDDKHFPYVKVTTDEPFPRLLIVRRLEKDKSTYFGPYTSSKGMRRTISMLTRLFKIRSCNLIIPAPEGKTNQLCIDYQLNRCEGPCVGLQAEEAYRENIKAVMMVLSGHSRKLIAELTEKMKQASKLLDFEEAKQYRDQVDALKAITLKQNVDVGEIVDRDIVSVARDGGHGVAVVMQLREGVLIGRQDYQINADVEDDDDLVISTFIKLYYNNQANLPDEICLPQLLSEMDLIKSWLKELKGKRVKLITPKIGQKVKLIDLAAKNARLLLDEMLLQKRAFSERTSKMVTSLQDELKLSHMPRRMVCFDISNTGETDSVGSCVYFYNGRPVKSQYRHFKIKVLQGQDDFMMMRQIIGRYFHRIREEKIDPPDLIVVDGGKGQLSSSLAELKSLGFHNQPIISLAKRLEEVFLPESSDSITIPKASPALMLLKRIRDEAHRFAITYNRKVRSKRTIRSQLDEIPGVGPAKRTALLKSFGSVKQIKSASTEKIAEVKGIPPKLAETIFQFLNK